VSSWNADEIVVGLLRMGPGSSGNVGGGHESNARQLLAWKGTITYSAVGPGTVTGKVSALIRIRANLNLPVDKALLPG